MGNESARFWAYTNYIIATSSLIQSLYDYESLADQIKNSKDYQRIQPDKKVDKLFASKQFRLGWYTELLLFAQKSKSDLLFYTIPWGMVQTYYAIYPLLFVFVKAYCGDVVNGHGKVLNSISSFLFHRQGFFPEPWCSIYTDDPGKTKFVLTNTCSGKEIVLANPLANPDRRPDYWDHYGLLLRTTRQRNLAHNIEEWKKRERKTRISQAAKAELNSSIPPTTIFNALYRIRVRANYKDVDSILFGETYNDETAYRIHDSFSTIVSYTNLILEILVLKKFGKVWFDQATRNFLESKVIGCEKAELLQRWELVLST